MFYLITSEDFQHWSQPRLVWTPDLRDDAGSLGRIEQVRPLLDVPDDPAFMRTEFYGISVYVAESCTLGFPWTFTINNNQRTGINQEGPIEIQLASSRDLVSWERHFRTPAISLGAIGEWDCGMIITQFRALRVGDEIWFYYGGCNYTHGLPDFRLAEETGRGRRYTTNVGLAKWKLDRFVSVDGPAEGGTLTTIPIVFDGKRLEINAHVRPGGTFVVEILDAAGRRIDGFEASDTFRGDDLRATITWRGDRNFVARLRAKRVTLKFHLKNCELYSFAFRPS